MDDFELVTTGQRLNSATLSTRNTLALRIRGDSMEPRFPHGTILIAETEAKPGNGSFVIARLNGEEDLIRQLAVENGVAYLKPLNPLYPIMRLDDGAVICSVVTRMIVDLD